MQFYGQKAQATRSPQSSYTKCAIRTDVIFKLQGRSVVSVTAITAVYIVVLVIVGIRVRSDHQKPLLQESYDNK